MQYPIRHELTLFSPSSGPVETMLEQIQSPSVDEQLSGLQLLATLTENPSHVVAIMELEIIRIIGPYLAAPNNPGLRLATVGALRNVSACGVEVCDSLYEQDLMTPLLALLNEYRDDWEPAAKDASTATASKQVDARSEVFLSAVHLLSNLCESCSEALDWFNNSHLLEPLLRCLDQTRYGLEISVAVAQLLLVVSEDNAGAWRVFHEAETKLVHFMTLPVEGDQFGEILLRTLATGIVANVPSLAQQHIAQVVLGLDRPFHENHRQLLNRLSSDIPLIENAKRFETEIRHDDPDMDEMDMDGGQPQQTGRELEAEQVAVLEKQIKNVGYLLEAQRVAAEILTNMCSSDDDPSSRNGGEMGDDPSEDEEEEVVHDYDDEAMSGSKENVTADKLPVELLEAIKSLSLVEKLWERAQPIAENVHEILVRHQPSLTKKLKLLRVSCLLCLHNLCNVMSTDDLGGAANIYKVWLDVGQQIFQGANKSDAHLLEASTALMRATLEHLKGSASLFAGMAESDLEMILSGVRACNEPEIRANWLRVLGTLGCLLPEPLVKQIMSYLLECSAQEEEDAWTISEAMDALMDMFADNDWPEVAAQLQLPQKIKGLERVLKIKLRQQKQELGERYSAVATVRSNLSRFAKYVEKEVLKGSSKR